MANNDSNDYCQLELQLHEKDYIGAIKICFLYSFFTGNRSFGFLFQTLNKIINSLKTNTNDNSNKLLIVYLHKRIKINFNSKNYKASF